MAIKLGSGSITLRLGDATYPTKAYLGDTLVAATVPGAPTINYATYGITPPATSVGFSAPADNGGFTFSVTQRLNSQMGGIQSGTAGSVEWHCGAT